MLNAFGIFKEDLDSLRFSFKISTTSGDGARRNTFAGEDDLCDWVDIKQNGITQCPPKKGVAAMSYEILLLHGWIPEVGMEDYGGH